MVPCSLVQLHDLAILIRIHYVFPVRSSCLTVRYYLYVPYILLNSTEGIIYKSVWNEWLPL